MHISPQRNQQSKITHIKNIGN